MREEQESKRMNAFMDEDTMQGFNDVFKIVGKMIGNMTVAEWEEMFDRTLLNESSNSKPKKERTIGEVVTQTIVASEKEEFEEEQKPGYARKPLEEYTDEDWEAIFRPDDDSDDSNKAGANDDKADSGSKAGVVGFRDGSCESSLYGASDLTRSIAGMFSPDGENQEIQADASDVVRSIARLSLPEAKKRGMGADIADAADQCSLNPGECKLDLSGGFSDALQSVVIGVGDAGKAVVERLMQHDDHRYFGDAIRCVLADVDKHSGEIIIERPDHSHANCPGRPGFMQDTEIFSSEGHSLKSRIVFVVCGASGESAERLAPKLASFCRTYYAAYVIGICFTPMDIDSEAAKHRAENTRRLLAKEVNSLIKVPLKLPRDTKVSIPRYMEYRRKRSLLQTKVYEHVDMLVDEFIRGFRNMINEPANINWDLDDVYRLIEGNKDLNLGMVRFWRDQVIDGEKIEDGLDQMIADTVGVMQGDWSQGILIQTRGCGALNACRDIGKYFREIFPNTEIAFGVQVQEGEMFMKAICLW